MSINTTLVDYSLSRVWLNIRLTDHQCAMHSIVYAKGWRSSPHSALLGLHQINQPQYFVCFIVDIECTHIHYYYIQLIGMLVLINFLFNKNKCGCELYSAIINTWKFMIKKTSSLINYDWTYNIIKIKSIYIPIPTYIYVWLVTILGTIHACIYIYSLKWRAEI